LGFHFCRRSGLLLGKSRRKNSKSDPRRQRSWDSYHRAGGGVAKGHSGGRSGSQGAKAKTRQGRIVTISETLAEWLALAPKSPRPAPSRNEDVCSERLKNMQLGIEAVCHV
jgi:hypothetical protein